jgi:hypothetical protein
MVTNSERETLLTEVEVSRWLRVSLATVRRWRLLGGGPKYRKLGASVRYVAADVDTFIQSIPVRGGYEEKANAS